MKTRLTSGLRADGRGDFRQLGVIEALEARISPAVVLVSWVGGDGNWSDPSKWSTGVVPNNAGATHYQVTLDVPLTTASISVDGTFTVDSIDNHESLTLISGSQLSLAGTLSHNQGLIDVQYAPYNTTLALGGTFTNDGTLRFDQIDWRSWLTGQLYLDSDTLIDGHGEILLNGTTAAINGAADTHFTLGSLQTVHGYGSVTVPVINHGTFTADSNVGWISVTAGITNDGVLGSTSGGQLSLEGPAASSTTADIVANTGIVQLHTTSLELNGHTLLAQAGEVRLDGSTVAHGSVQVSDHSSSIVTLRNAVTFTAAPWVDGGAGYFQVPGTSATLLGDRHIPAGADLIVSEGSSLDLSGATPFHNEGLLDVRFSPTNTTVTLGGTFTNDGIIRVDQIDWRDWLTGQLYLNSDTLIDGHGEILLNGTTAAINGAADTHLTLGSLQTLHGFGSLSVPVINHGTFSADAGNQWITVTGGITNDGVLGSTNGGFLSLEGSAGSSTTRDIVADTGVVQLHDTSLELNGHTLLAQAGEVRLDGSTIAHGSVQVTDHSSSIVTLHNAVTFTAAPWVDGGAGYFQVPNTSAALLGDRHIPVGADLIVGQSSNLDLSGATPFHNEGLIDVQFSPYNTTVTIGGTFTNDGVVRVDQIDWRDWLTGQFYLNADTLIDGHGEILLNGTTAAINGAGGSHLTLGPLQTLHGFGSVSVPVINHGTISADVAATQLTLTMPLENHGQLEAWTSGTLHAQSTVTMAGAGHFQGDADGVILLSGDLLSTGTFGGGPGTHANVRIEGSTDSLNPRLIEVVGSELGYTPEGFTQSNLFAPLTLTSGYYRLVNNTEDVVGDEAIYIDTLNVPAGATLDLNGQHIHVRHGIIDGTVIGDTGAPESHVTVMPPLWLGTDLQVAWTGQDAPGGTGIAAFDVWVSRDGAAPQRWLQDTTAHSAVYSAEDGHAYAFYTVARDNVGFTEAAPLVPDASAEVRVLSITTGALDGATEDTPYGFALHSNGEGVAGVTLTWSLASAPGGLAIDHTTGVLSGTFDNMGVGDHAMTVRVDDSQGHHSEQTFTLNVANVPGVFAAQTPNAAMLGTPYSFDLSSTDEAAGGVTYTITNGPAWLHVDPATGLLSGMPGGHDLGQPSITVGVDDGHGGTDTKTFTLDVQGQHLVLDPALKQTKAIFTDANGDTVTVALTGKTGRVDLYRAIAPDGSGHYLNTTAADLFAIGLDGTDMKSGLTLTAKANPKLLLGDGFSTFGELTGTGSLARLKAKAFDLTGSGVALPAGTIAALTLHDVKNGADINLGGTLATNGVSFTANEIGASTDLNFANGIKTMKAASWLGGNLTAPWLTYLALAADSSFDLTLTGTLGRAKLAGDLTDSTWDIAGKIATITVAGTVQNSLVRSGADITSIAVGASAGSDFAAGVDLATLIANRHAITAPTGTIKTFTVKGWRVPKGQIAPRFFTDSDVSAKIGTMKLLNWDKPGGLWAPTGGVKKITCSDKVFTTPEYNWVYPKTGQPAPDFITFL